MPETILSGVPSRIISGWILDELSLQESSAINWNLWNSLIFGILILPEKIIYPGSRVGSWSYRESNPPSWNWWSRALYTWLTGDPTWSLLSNASTSSLPNLHHRTQPRVGHNCSFTNPHSSDITFNLLLDVRAISFSSQNSLLHIASSIAVHRRLQPSAASTASCATRSQKIDMLRSWDQLSFRYKSASSIHHFIKIDDTITHLSTTTHISTRPNERLFLRPDEHRPWSIQRDRQRTSAARSCIASPTSEPRSSARCYITHLNRCDASPCQHSPTTTATTTLPTTFLPVSTCASACESCTRAPPELSRSAHFHLTSNDVPGSGSPPGFLDLYAQHWTMTSVDRYVDRRHLQTNWLIQHSSQTSKEVLVRYRRMVPPLPCVAAGDSLQQCRPSRPVSNVVDSASPNNPPSPALTTSCAFSTLLFQPDSTDPDRRAVPDHGPAAWAVNATVTVAAAVDPAIAARAREVRWGRLSARLLEVIIFE